MTRQQRHQRSRRAKGLCAREGCPETTGLKYLCQTHAAEHAARMRLRRQKTTALQVAA